MKVPEGHVMTKAELLRVTYHPSSKFPGEYWDVGHWTDGEVTLGEPRLYEDGRLVRESHCYPSFEAAQGAHPDLRVEDEVLRNTFEVES